MATLATKHRPRRFSEVVGQESEMEVARKMVTGDWRPSAAMVTGPFGTGKTTTARLIARALLCEHQLADGEPCGACEGCQAMDRDNHPNYVEVDAASQGSVHDVRGMKDLISYRVSGDKPRIICWDESHMLSKEAQNALLQTLEEGRRDTLFIMCTTESNKMLPTVKSRCIELRMKLLTMSQIVDRLTRVTEIEHIQADNKALRILASYVRGHVRDALITLEQLSRIAQGPVDEELVRRYLKLDRYVDIYQLLLETDRKQGMEKLEQLLCNLSPSNLAEGIGEVLVNAYKLNLGIGDLPAVDLGFLKKISEARGKHGLLPLAESILSLHTDYATINYATASFANLLFEKSEQPTRTPVRLGTVETTPVPTQFRKPGM